MNIQLEHGSKSVNDYVTLIECYPQSESDSPYRSTVPFLCFWSNIGYQLNGLAQLLGIKPFSKVTACFEFGVDVQKGKGKPSQTDLMITSDDHAIAIEAKYTEPPYETVLTWMGNSSNRIRVLEGWLDLISSSVCKNRINVEDIVVLPYQLVHRCASVCFPGVVYRTLIYQCFDLDEEKALYYRSQLETLIRVLKKPEKLHFFLVNIPLLKSPAYTQLQARWDSGERIMHADVIRGMKTNEFLAFGKPMVISIE